MSSAYRFRSIVLYYMAPVASRSDARMAQYAHHVLVVLVEESHADHTPVGDHYIQRGVVRVFALVIRDLLNSLSDILRGSSANHYKASVEAAVPEEILTFVSGFYSFDDFLSEFVRSFDLIYERDHALMHVLRRKCRGESGESGCERILIRRHLNSALTRFVDELKHLFG